MQIRSVKRPVAYHEVIKKLKALSNPEAVAGMARFGVNPENALGISIPDLRRMAKEIGKDHLLARRLWDSEIHEARILAGMIDDPEKVSGKQMDRWAKDFDSWDICDQCCSNLFDKTPSAYQKTVEWTRRKEEFVKRAGFVLMACLAVHDKETEDKTFLKFLPILKRESRDERNFVRKAVNWALRQIGKRSLFLNEEAIRTAREIKETNSKSAKWIASDAFRELTNEKIRKKCDNRR
jgi:3-methyladenine DNA glycosylase AlkD